jgi:hypothetical protein
MVPSLAASVLAAFVERSGGSAGQAPLRRRLANLSYLGVWRSLVARAVRVGEVPGSNPGTPI